MKKEYVELGRRFVTFRDTFDPEEQAWVSYYRPEHTDGHSFDWKVLLGPESRCVVVLGEAGSGKSCEFEARAELLNKSGVSAFLVPLEDLLDRKLRDCLERSDAARFTDWLGCSERAVIFLDAIDDGRLKDAQALRKALRELNNTVGSNLRRTCVVLSCRVSDWQPTSDRELLQTYFGDLDTADEELPILRQRKAPVFVIVQLAPLDRNQVELLARAHGVDLVDEFLTEIDKADAWIFARRPKDVDDLVGYWKEHRKLGSLTDLIEQNLARKLREPKVRDDPLEAARARSGAERLAAGAILCRQSTFRVPDEAGPWDAKSSLDPSAILPDFLMREQRAVLARAVFDEATYGRVRFHHRAVREYLAGSWLRHLLDRGYRPAIEDLLFSKRHGREFIAPSLLPVASWLASFDSDIRRRVLNVEPLALIQYGDPEKIDPAVRASMLPALTAAYDEQMPVWLDASQLRRFADQCFASKINSLLLDSGLSEHSKYFLLLLIWWGRVVGCAGAAFKIATEPTEEIELRSLAIRALGATANESLLRELGEFTLKSPDIPHALAGAVFAALYPRVLDVEKLLELIKSVNLGDGRPSDAPTFALSQIFSDRQKTPTNDLSTLVTELLALVTKPPLTNASGVDLASQRYGWLLEPLKSVLVRGAEELKDIARNAELCRTFRHAYKLLAACHQYGITFVYDLDKLDRALTEHPELRRALYWDRIAEEAVAPTPAYLFPEVPRLNESDLDWLLKDSEDLQIFLVQREMAFEAAVRLWSWKPEDVGNAHFERLDRTATRQPQYRELLTRAHDARNEYHKKSSLEAAERENKKQEQRGQNIKNLRGVLDAIRLGKHVNALAQLINSARAKQNSYNFSAIDWRTIEKEFAEDIAAATRDGAIAFWRTWRPPLPHEGPPRQTPGEVGIGLAGIKWELERGLNLVELKSDATENAVRYALFEYNGFPVWLAQLAELHPDDVQRILVREVAAELDGYSGTALENVASSNSSIQELLSSKLEQLLRERDPKNSHSLPYVLSILAATGRQTEIAEVAKARVPTLSSDRPRRMEWLTAWFQAEPESALDFLEGLGPDELHSAVSDLASQLGFRQMSSTSDRPTFTRPSILKRLIPLVFRQVLAEFETNSEQVRGAIDTSRPDARFFRESILEALATTPGDEAYQTLIGLAAAPALYDQRRRLLKLAERQAANDCERSFDPDEPYKWEIDCLGEPKTSEELFRVVVRRLDVLKQDLEQGDFSERGLFNPHTNEPIVQKYVANRLKMASYGQYSVHREEEVDLENRTDIRIWHSKDLVVTIEVKCADKWTYHQLRQALEEQLVGKYLRAHNSRCGVFLLADMGGKNFWKGPDRENLSFKDLILRLDGDALQISEANIQVSRLTTLGIDFRN
jgi:hypothetical protein